MPASQWALPSLSSIRSSDARGNLLWSTLTGDPVIPPRKCAPRSRAPAWWLRDYEVRTLHEEEVARQTAQLISEGKIVGWFQGRAEWGPRALGNRSIVVDPRRSEMKDMLNSRIKHREMFRPFAPSILEEHTDEYFMRSDPSPFMTFAYSVRPGNAPPFRRPPTSMAPAACRRSASPQIPSIGA